MKKILLLLVILIPGIPLIYGELFTVELTENISISDDTNTIGSFTINVIDIISFTDSITTNFIEFIAPVTTTTQLDSSIHSTLPSVGVVVELMFDYHKWV